MSKLPNPAQTYDWRNEAAARSQIETDIARIEGTMLPNGSGFVLRAPNGSHWLITVSNAGALVVTAYNPPH